MSYTIPYGKTYEEWVDEKARRIQSVLRFLYLRELPIDFQMLAYEVYRERLLGVSKIKWKPLDNRFLDFKPSPFIKNFINYLFFELVDRGYVINGYIVELHDRARTKEVDLETSLARPHYDGMRKCHPQFDSSLLPPREALAERPGLPLGSHT